MSKSLDPDQARRFLASDLGLTCLKSLSEDKIVTCRQWNEYCKFGNFRENFIFANSVKRHNCDVKNSRLGHDLPTSVNDRVILSFREGYILTKLRKFHESKTLAKISEFTV